MKFVCDRCQTKYSIADDRVRGKILKVKCKTCANVMTVRDPARLTSATGIPSIPQQEPESDRTVLAPHPGLFQAPPPPPPTAARKSGTKTGPHAPAGDDGIAWYMALSGDRSGPFGRKQLVDKIAALPRNADLHIWNEKLGAWKPPLEVPAIAADLGARRRATIPPLPSGAPRGTPSPPHGLPAEKPPRLPTGPIATAGGAGMPAPTLGHGHGLKLPPPTGGALPRPAMAASGAGGSAAHAHSHARAPEAGIDIDPSAMLETPAPRPHMHPGHHGTNGVGRATGGRASGAHPVPAYAATAPAATSGTHDVGAPAASARTSSDVLKMLNMPGAAQADGGPPRLMSVTEAAGWSPRSDATAARSRNAKMILGLLGIVGIVVVVLLIGTKKPKPAPVAQSKPPVTDHFGDMADKLAQQPPAPSPPPLAPPPPPEPQQGHSGKVKGRPGRGGKVTPPPLATAPGPLTTPGQPQAAAPPPTDPNARFLDTTKRNIGVGVGVSNRPPPSQGDISKVINNNRNGIKNCYQRALLRDSSLTHGKITVSLTLGISGRVKRSSIDGPAQFKSLEPCIKEVVARWAFPQASEEYGTEFVYVFQGNE